MHCRLHSRPKRQLRLVKQTTFPELQSSKCSSMKADFGRTGTDFTLRKFQRYIKVLEIVRCGLLDCWTFTIQKVKSESPKVQPHVRHDALENATYGILKGLQDSFQGRVDGEHWITMTTNVQISTFPVRKYHQQPRKHGRVHLDTHRQS